eukprot:scaffold1525_cov142-Cylindrotheca_fusiformis.AAC.163
MRFEQAVLLLLALSNSSAFSSFSRNGDRRSSVYSTMAESAPTPQDRALTVDAISKLHFREAQRELERLELDTSGTLSAMRNRLRDATQRNSDNAKESGEVRHIDEEKLNEAFEKTGIRFQDNSDPDFEFKDLIREALAKAEQSHWKAATRKLKKLTRRFGKNSADPRTIPESVYLAVLEACMEERLHGARATEPARKIMEEMVEQGYAIPENSANHCLSNCLGTDANGSHQGFGGIDTALAMMAAIEHSENPPSISLETYSKLILSLAVEGSHEEAFKMLRELVAEKSETPSLQLFADVASTCFNRKDDLEVPEQVMTVLAYVKAAGYELEKIASVEDGRRLLAAGVIAAEKLNNIGLGLRLLVAASNAKGCEPDKGDVLVANSSPSAQRAATIIHRKAIAKATQDDSWKLSVKLLEIMIGRGLTPSPSTWRNVVTCCTKLEKSRKATSLLMDWVQLSEEGRAEKPPLRTFNTVVNACEVCGEEELTVKVLEAMKETHNTDGNLITFNIALKRLAKLGNTMACEGIIVGMLQSGIEPSVVSYTTAIAACVADPKKPDIAYEWIKRMRSRNVQPNVITYNTAFASCLDGTLEGSTRASKLAEEMKADIQRQVDSGILAMDEYTNIIPNFYTRSLAQQAMKQLKQNWLDGQIDKQVAKATLRKPLLELVEFMKSDLASVAEQQKDFVKMAVQEVETVPKTLETDEELEYATAIRTTARVAAV